MDHQPKISIVEGFILMSFSLLIDGIGIVLVIFALDDFFLTDIFSWTSTIYFAFKGIPMKIAKSDLIGNFCETIPYFGAFPWKSLFMAWAIGNINHDSQPASIPTTPSIKIKKPIKVKAGAPTAPGIKTPVGGLARQAATQPPLVDGFTKMR